MDNRGQNESPHSIREDAYSVQSLARDVIELVTVLNVDKPHLLGHSLGGVIAQRAVSINPDFFRSLSLMCSGPQARPHPEFPLTVRNEFIGRTMAELWESYFHEDGNSTPLYEMRKKRWMASDLRSLLTHADELINFTSVVDVIAQSDIPSHVFYGEHDDAWPFEMQLEMAEKLKAEVHVIMNAGHCPNEDQPEITAHVIADFWDKN
jgi:pimeloyl-ACP methyl ester carboxylesterase